MVPVSVRSRKIEIGAAVIYWTVANVDISNRFNDERLFDLEENDIGRIYRGDTKSLYQLVCEQIPIELNPAEFRESVDILGESRLSIVMNNQTDFPHISMQTFTNTSGMGRFDHIKETRNIWNRGVLLLSEKFPVFSRLVGEDIADLLPEFQELARILEISEIDESSSQELSEDIREISELLEKIDNAAFLGKIMVLKEEDHQKFDRFIKAATEIINSSNVISVEQKSVHIAHFEALMHILDRTKVISIGALKYLFVDRLKAAADGLIEDTFKAALILILGTISAFALSRV